MLGTRELLASRRVHPVGLFNLGNTCFLNSLVQALLSCPAFNAWIVHNAAATPLLTEFAGIYTEMAMPQMYQNILNIGDIARMVLVDKYVDKNTDAKAPLRPSGDLRMGRQEDVEECFHRIIDLIQESTRATLGIAMQFESLFALRYKTRKLCLVCGGLTEVKDKTSKPQMWLDVPLVAEYGSVAGDRPIDNATDFAQFIRKQTEIVASVDCDTCKAKTHMQFQRILSRTSQIMVLVFKKYEGKRVQFFPTSFTIDRGSEPAFQYCVVAQIEQSGNAGGGHYYAYGSRITPSTGTSVRTAVYNLNDSYVEPRREGFTPTHNTYMVFYSRM